MNNWLPTMSCRSKEQGPIIVMGGERVEQEEAAIEVLSGESLKVSRIADIFV